MILGVAFALLGIAVAWPAYTHLVNVPESYLDMTLQCFRIYAVGLVFQYGYNIFPSILRAVSDSRAMTASFTVGNRIEMYLNLPCNAFQTTLATYTGQNIGANRMDQVKQLFGAFQGANHSGIPAIVATGALKKYRTIRRHIWRCLFRHLRLADFSIYLRGLASPFLLKTLHRSVFRALEPSKPSKSAIASVEKFTRQLTTLIARYFPNDPRAGHIPVRGQWVARLSDHLVERPVRLRDGLFDQLDLLSQRATAKERFSEIVPYRSGVYATAVLTAMAVKGDYDQAELTGMPRREAIR